MNNRENIDELRYEFPYMDGDSWFVETVPRLIDSLEKAYNEIDRLEKGIDRSVYNLANEDIYDVNVVEEIRMELVRLKKGEVIEQHPFDLEI